MAKFKSKFYRQNRLRYDLARKDTLQLLPPKVSMKDLRDDYESMQNMIFGEKIDFDVILDSLARMQDEIKSY